jgi:predicted nucleic acid-binding protein
MIVYAESNFLLELAYLQEEHESCEAILDLAESGRIRLLLPAFAVVEARMSVLRQARQRAEFNGRLELQIRELSRSKPYADLPAKSGDLVSALVDSGEEERRRLNTVMERVHRISQILPTTEEILDRAYTAESELRLSPQDAVVYASVADDLHQDPLSAKVFLNRNSKDFTSPQMESALARGNCKLLTSFRAGRGFVVRSIS